MKNPSKYVGNELEYVKQVLEGDKWSSTEGSFTNRLEKEFAKKFGAKYAIAMNSGTSTLHAALFALGVKPGDEVITTPLTVIMDTSVILHCGAVPIYADIGSLLHDFTFNINPREIRKKITSKTKAIIPVSLYGFPCDMEEIKKIGNDYNIPVILDNAQHLSKHDADITSYSFENTKHISCGEGGMVLTNNEEWARQMRLFSNHGFKNSQADEGRTKLNLDVFQNPEYKRHSIVGYNYRLSELQAAVALGQLERSNELVEMRQNAAKKYREVFEICDKTHMFSLPEHKEECTYWTFPVLMNYEGYWKEFRKRYMEKGGDGIYSCWQLSYNEPAIEKLGIEGNCLMAVQFQKKIMQFKTNYRSEELLDEKIEILKDTIKEVSGR